MQQVLDEIGFRGTHQKDEQFRGAWLHVQEQPSVSSEPHSRVSTDVGAQGESFMTLCLIGPCLSTGD